MDRESYKKATEIIKKLDEINAEYTAFVRRKENGGAKVYIQYNHGVLQNIRNEVIHPKKIEDMYIQKLKEEAFLLESRLKEL